MAPILVCLLALGGLVAGYRFYSRFLERRVFGVDENEAVPSERFSDGVDFVPTRREVLWGHHFASIAGAAPILGPAMAIVWGWLPAMVWIVVGVIFMGAAHDFGDQRAGTASAAQTFTVSNSGTGTLALSAGAGSTASWTTGATTETSSASTARRARANRWKPPPAVRPA